MLSDEGAALYPVLQQSFDRITAAHPTIDLRLQTHNNRIDLATEGLDLAIRFGDGDWQGQCCTPLLQPDFAPVWAPALARELRANVDLMRVPLLRSYRQQEWSRWFAAAGLTQIQARGSMFDSSLAIATAAMAGGGVALLPLQMFEPELDAGRLVRPFAPSVVLGGYWLTRLRSRPESEPARHFREWLQGQTVMPSGPAAE